MTFELSSSTLAQCAKIITHQNYTFTDSEGISRQYSDEEVAAANDYVNILLEEYDSDGSDLDEQYIKLAQALQDYNEGEVTKEDVDNEMLNTFYEENSENGISEQVLNEVTTAYGEIGNAESIDSNGYGTNSGDEINKYFESGMYGSAWCAMFVSWLNDDGQDNSQDNENTFGFQEAVSEIQAIAEDAGYYEEKESYEPESGDLIVLKSGGASHIGMVYDVDDENIYTIEGNECNMVRAVVYDKDGDYYQNYVSGYVDMNEWTDGETDVEINTEFLPDLETAVLPESTIYVDVNTCNNFATGGIVNIYRE